MNYPECLSFERREQDNGEIFAEKIRLVRTETLSIRLFMRLLDRQILSSGAGAQIVPQR